jgi:hypothetical protein
MAIVQTQTTSFKAELYQGVHDLLTDDIYIALYNGNANLDASTTVYTTAEEITGTGYTAGGNLLSGTTVNTSGTTAYVNFANVQWDPAAFTTRCALIYNASKGNKSIAVLDFGADKTATSTFTITMPANTATDALIRSSY